MNLQEATALLGKHDISEEQLQLLQPAYIALDLDKADFCKIVDAIGIETIIGRNKYWELLNTARDEHAARHRYQADKTRLARIREEAAELMERIRGYERCIAELMGGKTS